jgi:hypothetical protein
MSQQVYQVSNTRHIAKKGRELFKALPQELVEKHHGQFVAIDVDSGAYFLGRTDVEATKKAREKHPGKVFYLGRLGYEAAFKR